MLSQAEMRRLFPHVDERRRQLGLPTDRAPTSHTYSRLARADASRPVQRTTLDNIDERLAGTDGLWPPGTAYWLATGQIERPGQRPGDVRPHADVEEIQGLFVRTGQIISRLRDVTPEQARRIRVGLDIAWAALDERQGL